MTPYSRLAMNSSSPTNGSLRCEYYENIVLDRESSVITNEIGRHDGISREVYYEDRTRWKNVQIGPIMYHDDVEALLSRKPNAVRNFINSLNSQMKKPGDKVLKNKLSGTVPQQASAVDNYGKNGVDNPYNYCKGYNSNNNRSKNLNELNNKAVNCGSGSTECCDEISPYEFDISIKLNKFNPLDHFKMEDRYIGQTERSYTSSDCVASSTPITDIQMFTSDICGNNTWDGFYNEDASNCRTPYRKLRSKNRCDSICSSSRDSFRYSRNSARGDDVEDVDKEEMKGIVETALGKSFLQSLSTLPEGINVLLFDTPRPGNRRVPNDDFKLNSVNVIKSGWAWIQSVVTHKWLPKYIVLFYDHTLSNNNIHITPKNSYVGNSSGFWSIYQIYSSLGNFNLDLDNKPVTPTASCPNNDLIVNKCIPGGAKVYLCILDDEVSDLPAIIMNRKYIELMQLDTSLIPTTRQITPSNWLSNLVARSMGREPLNLIVLPLVDGFECGFIPLCAAKFDNVKLSYKMQCARRNRVGKEYDQWMFYLWEYVVRNNQDCNIQPLVINGNTEPTSLEKCFNVFSSAMKSIWPLSTNANQNNQQEKDQEKEDVLRRRIINSISVDGLKEYGSSRSGVCSTEATERLVGDTIQDVDSDNLPSSINFANWINRYGFDDLSIKMNIYTLVNRR